MPLPYFAPNIKNGFTPPTAGQAFMVAVLLILFAMLTLITLASTLALRSARISELDFQSKRSYFLSESGIEDAVFRLKRGKNLPASYILSLYGANTAVTVDGIVGGKEIQSAADIKDVHRIVKTSVRQGIGVEFFYGAQMGEGGLKMEENSRIEGTAGAVGNVYSNGSVVGDNDATITGDLTVATSISADVQARSTVCNTDQIVGESTPQVDFAQSFKPSDTRPLSKVSLYIKKVGNPNDATIRIAADDSGSPATSALASAVLQSALVGDNYAWIDVTFSSPANLAAGSTYWIVLDTQANSNRYFIWCKDNNQGYGNGVGKYSRDWDDDPWALIVGDLTFQTFFGVGLSSITEMDVLGTARANTITTSQICGNAYYQSIDSSSLNFLNNPSNPTCSDPLTPGTAFPGSPDPPVENMPISDANIQDWKAAAQAGGVITGNCGDDGVPGVCDIPDDSTLFLGPKKIIGNLKLTKKQTLIINEVLYFTGSISIDSSSGATIKCDPALGVQSCILLTDSWVHISNNAIFQGSGTLGSYLMILTVLENCNGGTQSPSCTHHNAAIDLHNNATGAIFYASDSMTNLHNGVTVTELTSYKAQLGNGAMIRYEQGLINSNFTAGPSGGFDILTWLEVP